MPSWKKIIQSGSVAELNSLFVTNAITASIFSGSHEGDGSGLTGVVATADPAGPDTSVQFNDGGTTSGSSDFTFDKTARTVTVVGNVVATSFTGSLFGTSSWAVSASWAPGSGQATTASYALTASYFDGQSHAVYNQSSAAVTWSVAHNLNNDTPTVTVWRNDGVVLSIVQPQYIQSIDANNLEIHFPSSESGYATVANGTILGAAASVVSASFASSALTASYFSGAVTSASFASTALTASYYAGTIPWTSVTSIPSNIVSSSAQIATSISGAFAFPSASFSTRVTSLETKSHYSGSFSGSLYLTASLQASGRFSADAHIRGVAGGTLAVGDLCYLSGSTSRFALASAATTASAGGMLAICMTSVTVGQFGNFILRGFVRATALGTFTPTSRYYLSTTSGDVSISRPTGSGEVVRVVGYAYDANTFRFDPSPDFIQVT